mgnify:CR=1 FL=1
MKHIKLYEDFVNEEAKPEILVKLFKELAKAKNVEKVIWGYDKSEEFPHIVHFASGLESQADRHEGEMEEFSFYLNDDGQTILGEDEGGNDAGYFAVDLALKYSFGELLDSNVFDPYLSVGAGLSHFGDYTTKEKPSETIVSQDIFTVNAGLGMNFWFSSNWGVNLNATGKWGIAATSTNHLQSSIGVLYHIKYH